MPQRGGSQIERQRLSLVRARARGPRAALTLAAVVLTLAGLLSLTRGVPTPPRPASVGPRGVGPEVAALAERFARIYLSRADNGGRRDRQLAQLARPGSDGVAPAGSLGAGAPKWASVIAERVVGPRRRIVVVEAPFGRGVIDLAVPIALDRGGGIAVAGPPAIVGPLVISREPAGAAEAEVADPQLVAVASRAMRNFLAGERANLQADLAPSAQVSLPRIRLEVTDVASVTRTGSPGWIGVLVDARAPRGVRLTLRYELQVVRLAGRWLVQTVDVDPTVRGGWE